ncbi:MAG: histidine phosphatase family protein [Alphaproteobacteria bacterium]|nr:histidine phosphatase family protein [Alphaproteobacteria bacterium]
MRHIYVLRHAQKDNRSKESDRDVPLTAHGKEQAKNLGVFLKTQTIQPTVILCSDALRTRETAEHLLQGWEREQDVIFSHELYYTTAGGILTTVQKLDDHVQSVLLVGHNPGIHQFVMLMSDFKDVATLQKLKIEFPPGAFVGMALAIDNWGDAAPGQGLIEHCVYPLK